MALAVSVSLSVSGDCPECCSGCQYSPCSLCTPPEVVVYLDIYIPIDVIWPINGGLETVILPAGTYRLNGVQEFFFTDANGELKSVCRWTGGYGNYVLFIAELRPVYAAIIGQALVNKLLVAISNSSSDCQWPDYYTGNPVCMYPGVVTTVNYAGPVVGLQQNDSDPDCQESGGVIQRPGSVVVAAVCHSNSPLYVPPPAALSSRVPLPPRGRCRHLGDDIGAAAANRVGLPPARHWHPCGKGHSEPGYPAAAGTGLVCGCEVCKTCPDWRPEGDP